MSWISKSVSYNTLRVFECAARHLSFTRASRELRSTQSAVSQQVRALEAHLGGALFERIYRGVRLTPAGEELLHAVQDGFSTIDRCVERLRERHQHPHVNILTDFSFAAYWLLPRLPRFRRRHPAIDVRLVANQGVLDWRTQEIDVAIVFCNAATLAGGVPALFREEVFPVASPTLMASLGQGVTPAALTPRLTLTAEQGQSWLDWLGFDVAHGIGPRGGDDGELTFNNYTLLLQAAIAGQGVALGWRELVDDLLDTGLLVGLEHLKVTSDNGYGLVDPQPRAGGEAKSLFMRWVLEEAQAGPLS